MMLPQVTTPYPHLNTFTAHFQLTFKHAYLPFFFFFNYLSPNRGLLAAAEPGGVPGDGEGRRLLL